MGRGSKREREPRWVWVVRLVMQLVQFFFTVLWTILTK